jgi:NAD(P)H-dependent FMN reductase/ketosteroid isomerase-like protein
MNAKFKVAVLVGSLRSGSFTRRVAQALIKGAPSSLQCRLVEIGDLPLYNEDREGSVDSWSRFRSDIAGSDAALLLTPEYNRSIPACLKNAIDVGSRPQGKNIWDGKPAAVVSVTPYKLGGLGANLAVRQALVYVNIPVMQQPEAYISDAGALFGEDGSVNNEETQKFLADFLGAFAQWVAKFAHAEESTGFEDFMRRRAEAATAYVNGDAELLDAIAARTGGATFFPPNGGYVSGANEVVARYDSDAKIFSPQGTTDLEILQKEASSNTAFWTGFQSAEARIGGKLVKMKLRVTEIFRLSAGEWKLIHRHADSASEAKP